MVILLYLIIIIITIYFLPSNINTKYKKRKYESEVKDMILENPSNILPIDVSMLLSN